MVSELVLTRNQLLEISRRTRTPEFKVAAAAAVQRHRRTAGRRDERRGCSRSATPGKKLPRIVRDLSGELGKQIELEMQRRRHRA